MLCLLAAGLLSLSDVAFYSIRIKHAYRHDRTAFTQGLVYDQGFLYEGLGLKGSSAIRKVRLETGEVLQERKLGPEFFGEGIALWKGELFQVTWTTRIGFVYKKKSFRPLRQFHYNGEGWGLTCDGARLIMSDGSDRLRFLDPRTLKEAGGINVKERSRAISRLNELEIVDGMIYANIWQTNQIVVVDPKSGAVTAWINLELAAQMAAQEYPGIGVLNGIAYDPVGKRLFVTGKLWPRVFEIELVRAP